MTVHDRPTDPNFGLTPFKFTWAEVLAMSEAGLFDGGNVELIGGEIFEMPPEGPTHVNTVRALQKWLLSCLGSCGFEVCIREPVHFADGSAFVPDLSVFPAGTDARGMQAERAVLVIEVVDSTEARDRTLKLPRYAKAGVQEVWIVQALARAVQVYRAPLNGEWTVSDRFLPGRPVAPLATPEMAFDPEVLPQPDA